MFMAYQAYVFAFSPAVTKRLFRRRLQMGLDARRRQKELFMALIDARRERKKLTPKKKDTSSFEHAYVDTLFDIKLPNEEGGSRRLTDDELVSLCSEFLAAGTDTTGASVHFTVAEMGRDETEWERPMEFSPERFLPDDNSEGVDVTGSKGIRMMPFGAGRRICAGLGVAMMHLEYFVANLMREFEWHEVPGDEVDMAERHEITTVMKKPASCLVPRRMIPRGLGVRLGGWFSCSLAFRQYGS
ncbi:hypothetical protein HU200_022505 [Digitaria exilis]|uniref:Cytochrome P450 n=1 Tax=Digitaria exilis TaxID=1010633 RepID=A0A835CDQ9_9POAL|nr:hypothetical protein HU200_022505 [Digitaria exilis]